MALSDEALTPDEQVESVRTELGLTSGTAIYDYVEMAWRLNADKDPGAPYLRMLYTKRAVLSKMRSDARSKVDTSIGGDRISASQLFKHLGDLLAEVDGRINEIEGLGADEGIGSVGSVTPTTALPPFRGSR